MLRIKEKMSRIVPYIETVLVLPQLPYRSCAHRRRRGKTPTAFLVAITGDHYTVATMYQHRSAGGTAPISKGANNS